MRRYSNSKIWFIAFLPLIFSVGCCNPAANPSLAAPIVTSEMPLSASAGLCTTVVTATFSLPMNPTSINGSTFTLAGPGTAAVTGTVSYDASSTTATFTPSSALVATTLYTATITTGATGQYGIALAGNFVWTFTTGSCVAPTVNSVTPLAGAVGVCPSTAVAATLSQAMNPSTINTTTFTLTTGTPPVAVAGVVTYAGSTATFTPSNPLALNTSYTATITTGATDLSGAALASNVVWTFTTGSSCVPPTVISVTPLSGSVGVCPSTALTATFSQAMNPSTINTTTFTLTAGTPPVAVAGVVTYAGSTATFTPSSPLALNTTYTATITTGATDLSGAALASNFVWTFTTATVACTPPVVVSVAPPNLAVGICPNTLIVATFNQAMNPATINMATFTLTSPGDPPMAVAGAITYNPSISAATFTPTDPLALNTTYTATITTGAQNLAGDSLVSDFVWTFTTSATVCNAPVPLGTACSFGILGGASVSSTPTAGTAITGGDIGVWPGTAITGFPPGIFTGTEHAGDVVAETAQGDLTTAYNYAVAVPGGIVLPADIGGETLPPGVYKTTSGQPSLGITGDLTLTGDGVYIFQIVSTLTTAAGNSQVILAGGALSQNVFWQVGSSATLGTNTIFQGILMAQASISLTTGATLDGNALARTGTVSLDENLVDVPACPGP